MKRFKFLWLAVVIMIGFVMPLNSYALSVNGLSVSNDTLTQGDEFEVNINIPANSENADTASIKVEFDYSAFEVKSWEPVVSGATAGSGDGYFTIAAANAERKIDLSNGLTLTATLEVKNTAQNGSYDIKLTKNSLSYVADNGYDYVELWSPEVKSVSVTVDSESTVTPPTKDDITVSSNSLKPNDEFNVYINIPANSEKADTASIKVEFDYSAFEVKSWEPVVSGATAGSGGGYFTLAAANAERKIDLSNGLTLTATLKVKSSAKSGDYDIKLTKSSLSYVTDNGYDYVELWSPSVKKVAVNVTAPTAVTTATTTPAKTTTAKTTTTTTAPKTTTTTTVKTTTRPDNSTTPKVTTTTSKKTTITTTPPHPTGSPGFYTTPVRTTPATTTTKVKTTTTAETTAKKTTAKTTEDELFYDDEPDDEEENLDEPDIEDEIEISLSNKLKGISGKKASVSTKYRFFANNTKIILSNTDYADECAKVAAQNLRLEDYPYYAFDISVYDEVHGEYLKSLENDGYIELKLPLTEELSAVTSELKVYHIETGYLELIESEIVFDEGVSKIVFRANSFSPYMIIDTVNKREPALITDVTTTTPTAGYVNPDTGAAAAITIPAVLVGCVMLVKKNGRKRGRKG